MIRHHPSEATLVGYAAGALWEAAKPVVAAHLARCPDCRAKLELAEAVGGLLLEGLPPTVVYASSRDRLVIDALRLRERVVAEDVSNVTFRLRAGLLHDYAMYAPLPDARAERGNLYADLGL